MQYQEFAQKDQVGAAVQPEVMAFSIALAKNVLKDSYIALAICLFLSLVVWPRSMSMELARTLEDM